MVMLLPLFLSAQSPVRTVIIPASPYTTSNQTTWTAPSGVYYVSVECIGGGGGGSCGMTGGGGGAYSYKTFAVTPGVTYYIQAGGAGVGPAGGSGAKPGGNGGDSYFKSGSHTGTDIVLAKGGTGGSTTSGTAVNGGQASSGFGDIKTSGGKGGVNGSSRAGGGGGAGGIAGDGQNGVSGSNNTWNGALGGYGNPHDRRGNGGQSGGDSGFDGEWYGGGGSGSTKTANKGGNGGPGAVIITYNTILPPTYEPITNLGSDILCLPGGTTTLQVNLPKGGTITRAGTDYVHSFTTASTFDYFLSGGNIGNLHLLVLGGGGGGGRNGGGGAGEFVKYTGSLSATAGIFPIYVGSGGLGGNQLAGREITGYRGGVSMFSNASASTKVLANGGGGGASRDGGGAPSTGGSGAGGSNPNGTGWSEQNGSAFAKLGGGNGNNGGTGEWSTASCGWYGGGGGGAGSAGTSTNGAARNTKGTGGNSISDNITGTSKEYAAGGGCTSGCVDGTSTTPSNGGSSLIGGGNNGSNGVKTPDANTGSGGMGGGNLSNGSGVNTNYAPQAGSEGIVIVRYPKGSWSSSAPGVATVSEDASGNGVVTAVAAGTTTISYTIGGLTYGTYAITVRPLLTPSASAAVAACADPTSPYAELTATAPGAGISGAWSKVSGSGTIADATQAATAISGLTTGSPTQVQWTLFYTTAPACSTALATPISITPSTTLDAGTVSLAYTPPSTYYSCITCNVKNGKTYTYFDNAGKIIAKVVDPSGGSIEMGVSEICEGYDYNPSGTPSVSDVKTVTTSFGDQQPYLPRHWSINPTTKSGQSVDVTLYFTAAEYNALFTKAAGTEYAFGSETNLVVTKFDGGSAGTFTAPPNYPATNGTAKLIFPTITKSGSVYAATFSVSNFSTFYIHPNRFPFAPLPVELVSFTGWNAGSVNRLRWVTASELNTDYFEIQKSVLTGVWESLGRKTAAGNSNAQLTYDFTDNNPVIGDNYYRLKIVDKDGSFKYSNVIDIPISEAVVNNFSRLYPNPTSGNLNVEIQSISLYDTKLSVYNSIGEAVFEKPVTLVKGLNTIHLDFSRVAQGVYIMQFADADGKLHTTKFVKD